MLGRSGQTAACQSESDRMRTQQSWCTCTDLHKEDVDRQWPEVYDLCHTFLHLAGVKKPTAMRELSNMQKCVTKSDT